MIKYQGIVTDRMNGESVKTRYYTTWGQAQAAAEKLCEKYYLKYRGNINVNTRITK